MKVVLTSCLVCVYASFIFVSVDSRTLAETKDSAASRVRDAKIRDLESALSAVNANADSNKKINDDRQIESDSKLRAVEASTAALKVEVEALKKDNLRNIVLPIIAVLISASALALNWVQHYKRLPRIKGRALLEWTIDRSVHPPGLPRPNFRLELLNTTDSEVKLTKLVFHSKRATDAISVPFVDEFADKPVVIPPLDHREQKIPPSLKILDVVRVEAHSPTKSWDIGWNQSYTRRYATFKSLKTEFFFNEQDSDELVLDIFQAGEKFYLRKAGYQPRIPSVYGFVEAFESEAAALQRFENEHPKENSAANESRFVRVSSAKKYFDGYW